MFGSLFDLISIRFLQAHFEKAGICIYPHAKHTVDGSMKMLRCRQDRHTRLILCIFETLPVYLHSNGFSLRFYRLFQMPPIFLILGDSTYLSVTVPHLLEILFLLQIIFVLLILVLSLTSSFPLSISLAFHLVIWSSILLILLIALQRFCPLISHCYICILHSIFALMLSKSLKPTQVPLNL